MRIDRRGLGGLLGALGLVGKVEPSPPPLPQPATSMGAALWQTMGDEEDGVSKETRRAYRKAIDKRSMAMSRKTMAKRFGVEIPLPLSVEGNKSWAPWFKAEVAANRRHLERLESETFRQRLLRQLGMPEDFGGWE